MSEIEPSERASCGGHTPYDIRASQEIATHPPVPRACEATLRVSKKRPVYAAARLPKRRLDTRAELDAPKQVHTYIDARRHLPLIAAHIAAVVVLPSVFVFSMLPDFSELVLSNLFSATRFHDGTTSSCHPGCPFAGPGLDLGILCGGRACHGADSERRGLDRAQLAEVSVWRTLVFLLAFSCLASSAVNALLTLLRPSPTRSPALASGWSSSTPRGVGTARSWRPSSAPRRR